MANLLTTPLHAVHIELGAKMVPFAGYDMPVQYPMGVLKEHLHTRSAAGLFDVSHMGQVKLTAKSGNIADAALALETLVPVDILGLEIDRQRYGFFTNTQGGIEDDLMIANRGDHLFLVVNAACKDADFNRMQEQLSDTCILEMIPDRALIALQGPGAEAALSHLAPGAADMLFMDVATLSIAGVDCWVSRSGYTGEDGYEISIPNSEIIYIVNALLAIDDVSPIGLGARDSLRLEAGLCLYGHDIDSSTSPIEASLIWAIQKIRRAGGDRAGGFPGADVILGHIADGADRKRIGLVPAGRAPMRDGTNLFASQTSTDPIGSITSGGFGPTVGHPVSMGYVVKTHSAVGTTLYAEVRGKRLAATVTKMPFTPANFKR